jgi:hypothetical protein
MTTSYSDGSTTLAPFPAISGRNAARPTATR